MTQFYERDFAARFAQMGDASEAAFDSIYPKNHKLGLNRPPFYMGNLTDAMRYTPDRMTAKHIVECMGIGRDGTLKIKLEKLDALGEWEAIGPVNLFVFDQAKNTWYEAPVFEWLVSCLEHGELKAFPEGKDYWALRRDNFPTAPTSLEETEPRVPAAA